MQGRPTFFLTGGSEDPATLCAQLAAEGFGDVQAVVGQCLGTPKEKIFRGSVKELAAGRFNSLSVLLAVSYTHLDVYKRQTQEGRE